MYALYIALTSSLTCGHGCVLGEVDSVAFGDCGWCDILWSKEKRFDDEDDGESVFAL
jgi:hypothetical protein